MKVLGLTAISLATLALRHIGVTQKPISGTFSMLWALESNGY